MIDTLKLEKSKKLYDEAKAYFVSQNITECVIEISDKPMSEWVVHFTRTEDEMFEKRADLGDSKKPFIAIHTTPEGKYFFLTDFVIRTLELLETKTIIFSHVYDFEEVDKKKMLKEYLELKKMLQNS